MDVEDSQNNRDRGFFREIFAEAFDLKYGLLQTALILFKHPQKVVNSYVQREKSHYYSPYKYVMIVVAVFTLVFFLAVDFEAYLNDLLTTTMENRPVKSEEVSEHAAKILDYYINIFLVLKNQYNSITTLLIWLPSLALFSFWFFKKKINRLSNHFALNAYYVGQVNIVKLLFCLPLFFLVLPHKSMETYIDFYVLMQIAYLVYAYFRLFYDKKFFTAVKCFSVPIIGYIVHFMVINVIALGSATFMVFWEGQK